MNIDQLIQAIRSTTSDPQFNEIAIRRAVSFELAELLVDVRAGSTILDEIVWTSVSWCDVPSSPHSNEATKKWLASD